MPCTLVSRSPQITLPTCRKQSLIPRPQKQTGTPTQTDMHTHTHTQNTKTKPCPRKQYCVKNTFKSGAYTRRNKENNEITPVSGYGSGLDKSAKLARAPIDRDLDTYVYIYDYGDTTWYTMNLGDDRVFCIDEVIDFTSNGRKYTAWYCGSDRCSCRGSSCDSIFLSIFTTGQTLRNLPPRDCKYGNRVKLYKPSGISMSLYEVAVVGRAGVFVGVLTALVCVCGCLC